MARKFRTHPLKMVRKVSRAAALILLVGASALEPCVAETPSTDSTNPAGSRAVASGWSFAVSPYLWAASIDGLVAPNVPNIGTGGGTCCQAEFSLDSNTLLEALNFGLMVGAEARRGRFALYGDLVYLSLTDDSSVLSEVRGPGVGPVSINGVATLDASTDIKTTLFTALAGYEFYADDTWRLSSTAGVRMLHVNSALDYALSGEVSVLNRTLVMARSGRLSGKTTAFDGLIGLRGEARLGEHWRLPFNADVGAGESDLTWQAQAGVKYAFDWGGVFAGYRSLTYKQDDLKLLPRIRAYGPYIGGEFTF